VGRDGRPEPPRGVQRQPGTAAGPAHRRLPAHAVDRKCRWRVRRLRSRPRRGQGRPSSACQLRHGPARPRAVVPSSRSEPLLHRRPRPAEPALESATATASANPTVPLASGGLDAEGALNRIADAHEATRSGRWPGCWPAPVMLRSEHVGRSPRGERGGASRLRLTGDEFAGWARFSRVGKPFGGCHRRRSAGGKWGTSPSRQEAFRVTRFAAYRARRRRG
jgi:hypothetical protein